MNLNSGVQVSQEAGVWGIFHVTNLPAKLASVVINSHWRKNCSSSPPLTRCSYAESTVSKSKALYYGQLPQKSMFNFF